MRQAIATIVRRTAAIIRAQIIIMAIVPADMVPSDAVVVAVAVKTETKESKLSIHRLRNFKNSEI